MLHKMKLNPEEFDNIKFNNKIIEVRLNDEKRKQIKNGDEIVFYKFPELKDEVHVKVKMIHKFLTFKEVYSKFPPSYFGYDNLYIDQMVSKIYSIYSLKQEEQYGVVAITFEAINAIVP